MNAIQKIAAAAAASAVVFTITLTKERSAQAEYAQVRAEQRTAASPIDIVRGFHDLANQQGRPAQALSEFVARDVVTHFPGITGQGSLDKWLAQQGDGKIGKTVAQGDTVVVMKDAAPGSSAGAIVYRIAGGKIAEIWSFGAEQPRS